jgi:hypothetical protein
MPVMNTGMGSSTRSRIDSESSFFPVPDEQPLGDVDMLDAYSMDRRKVIDDNLRPPQRTFGQREVVPAKEIAGPGVSAGALRAPAATALPMPATLTRITAALEDTEEQVEAINSESGRRYLSSFVIHYS